MATEPETPIPGDDLRVFVIRLADKDGKFVGYAIAERVALIPATSEEAATIDRTVVMVSQEDTLRMFEALFQESERDATLLDAISIPASDDKGGRGLVLFAAAAGKRSG